VPPGRQTSMKADTGPGAARGRADPACLASPVRLMRPAAATAAAPGHQRSTALPSPYDDRHNTRKQTKMTQGLLVRPDGFRHQPIYQEPIHIPHTNSPITPEPSAPTAIPTPRQPPNRDHSTGAAPVAV